MYDGSTYMYSHKLGGGASARVRISVMAHTCACPRTCPRCIWWERAEESAHFVVPSHTHRLSTPDTEERRECPTNGRHPCHPIIPQPHPHSMRSVEQFIKTKYVDHPTCDYARLRVCLRASHSATFKIMTQINKT